MDKSFWLPIGLTAYVLLFMSVVLGIGVWRRRQRKEREPVEFKLLRAPGETLRRKLQKFDEDFIFTVFWASIFPFLPGLAVLQSLIWFAPHTNLYLGLGLTAAGFLGGAILSGRWLWSKFLNSRNEKLGYLGERTVGEALIPLLGHGYQVFHDIPAEAGNRKFNIDHVVVGPTGVFAIETKTRRKGRTRPGFKDHEVTFDGRQLIWPWGENRDGLDQAEAQARWLGEWLNKRTGIGLEVRPILALPGWMVKERQLAAVRVLNAKNVPSAIRGRNERVLTLEQIDLIARQLDERCRDVED